MHYTHKNIKARFGNYDTYHEPLLEEWLNGRSRNHFAHTIVLSAVKLSRKLQHPIYWVELINLAKKSIKSIKSTKRQGWIGYYLNILFIRLHQKYQQHP